MKSCYNSNVFWKVFGLWFPIQTVPKSQSKNVSIFLVSNLQQDILVHIALEQNVLILLVRNTYNGNIGKLLYRKFWMNSWYENCCECCWFFLGDSFGPNCPDTSILTLADTLRSNYVDSFCQQKVKWDIRTFWHRKLCIQT